MALITALIVISILSVVLESVQSIYSQYREYFVASEIIIVIIFTIEYALRLWSCTEDGRYQRPIVGRLRYASTIFAIIDLAAILPFYLPFFVAFDARFLRVLRLIRFIRVAKLARYSESAGLMTRVIRREKESLLFTFFLIIVLMVFASCLMFQAENEVQPEKFGSIPDTMWWAIATITTVGYGDVVPITPIGKVLGAFIAILGVGMVAMPAGIIVSGYIEEMKAEDEEKEESTMFSSEKRIELLERLARLKENGVLTNDEFILQKAELLESISKKDATGDQDALPLTYHPASKIPELPKKAGE
ncbi:MAG: ion transporter [Methanomassiliicoccus sp.]|nr:ion transporter [Methanomassiliicoccus sp.]